MPAVGGEPAAADGKLLEPRGRVGDVDAGAVHRRSDRGRGDQRRRDQARGTVGAARVLRRAHANTHAGAHGQGPGYRHRDRAHADGGRRAARVVPSTVVHGQLMPAVGGEPAAGDGELLEPRGSVGDVDAGGAHRRGDHCGYGRSRGEAAGNRVEARNTIAVERLNAPVIRRPPGQSYRIAWSIHREGT